MKTIDRSAWPHGKMENPENTFLYSPYHVALKREFTRQFQKQLENI